MMQAVVLNGVRNITIEPIEEPTLKAPTDVLLRLTSTAICGTDLHMYEGRLGGGERMVIGHEPLGVVERVGDAVVNVRVGDRVTVPTHICCGFCANCVHGYSAQCLTNNPGKAGGAYGYPGMGGYTGAQTELLRVPFGDANCVRLPGEPGDRFEDDFVLLADALPTAYHATELASVRTNDIVVIYGAGAIGLLTAMCAFVRGAAQVFVVDAIGFQARDPHNYAVEHPTTVIDDLARLIAPKGRLAIIGVFLDSDPHAHSNEARRGEYVIPWGVLFKKGVTIGMGRDDDENYNDHLRDMIVAGRIKPSTIVCQVRRS